VPSSLALLILIFAAAAAAVWGAGLQLSKTTDDLEPRKRIWRLGPDSSAVVFFYALGMIGLVLVNR
jgi:hypothetical protein